MEFVTVVARRAFTTDDGRSIQDGEAVDLIPIEAAVRGRRGDVSLDPQTRPTYQTRDMLAAPLAVAVLAAPAIVPAPQVRTRRRRRKKVLTA